MGLLHDIPETFDGLADVARVMRFSGVWFQYYESAEYGIPNLKLTFRDLITKQNAERAIEDAEFCFETAYSLYKHETGQHIEW